MAYANTLGKGTIMKKKRFIIWGLVIVGMFILSEGAVKAGTVIDQEMTDIWGKQGGSLLFYSKKKLRIDQKDGRLSTIMDFKNDQIVILDHASKSYVEYPFSLWEKQVSQKIEPRNRQKREIRVEPTGAEKHVNGFMTRQIQIFIDGVLFQDTWVTQDVDLEEMLETIKEVSRLSSSSKADVKEKEEIYQRIKKWGFPIFTTEYRRFSGKTLTEITEVKGIKTRNLGSDVFTPPRGYIKRAR